MSRPSRVAFPTMVVGGWIPGRPAPGSSDDQMVLMGVTRSSPCDVGVEIILLEMLVVTVVEVVFI